MNPALYITLRAVCVLLVFSAALAALLSLAEVREGTAGHRARAPRPFPWAPLLGAVLAAAAGLELWRTGLPAEAALHWIAVGPPVWGWLTTAAALSPAVVAAELFRRHVWSAPARIRDEALAAGGEDAVTRRAALDKGLADLDYLAKRAPLLPSGRIAQARDDLEAERAAIFDDYNLERARRFLENRQGSEALRSLNEWKRASAEALLLAMEVPSFPECARQLDLADEIEGWNARQRAVIAEEARQLIADAGWSAAALREKALEGMRGEIGLRRKAFVLYNHGEAQRARQLLREDPHACYWLNEF